VLALRSVCGPTREKGSGVKGGGVSIPSCGVKVYVFPDVADFDHEKLAPADRVAVFASPPPDVPPRLISKPSVMVVEMT
jgi:hypothetical protein